MGRKKSQAVKTRQLMRSAKLARYKQMLREAGEDIRMPKPSIEARKRKGEELRRMYLELISEKEAPRESEEVERSEQSEQGESPKTEQEKHVEESQAAE